MISNTPTAKTRSLVDAIRFPRGFRVDEDVRAEMAERWNHFRPVAAGTTMLAGLVLWFFGFHRVWVAVLLGVVVFAHSIATHRRVSPAVSLALDMPLAFVTLELIGAPSAVMAIAYVTYGVIAILICGPVARFLLWISGSLLLIGAAFWDLTGVPPSFARSQIVGWTASAIFLALLLATVAMTIDLLQRHVEKVDRANHQLKAMARSKDDLIATISHEIRTPLAAVLGFSTELRDAWEQFSPAEGKDLAHLIAAEGRDISHIVDDLVVAARGDSGSLAVRLEPVLLMAEIEGFFEESRNISHPIEIFGQDVEAEVDPPRFRQILRHLLGNAVVHGGDRVWVEIAPGPGIAFVRVCDDGDGVPEEKSDRIFSPYVRGRDRSTRPEPFGLGLTIARLLAGAMGGSLTYQRKMGISVFELVLRSANSDRPLPARPHASETQRTHQPTR